jgi:hypothetical protein
MRFEATPKNGKTVDHGDFHRQTVPDLWAGDRKRTVTDS